MCNRVLFFILTEQNHIQVADARIMYDVKSELVSLETRFKIHLSRIPILSFIMPSCLMCVLSTCHMICHQFYCPFLTAYISSYERFRIWLIIQMSWSNILSFFVTNTKLQIIHLMIWSTDWCKISKFTYNIILSEITHGDQWVID